ncbi:hypothetical protein V1522DRAFT_454379 [Lipomyces starkeyi]
MRRIWFDECDMNDLSHFTAAAIEWAEVYVCVMPKIQQRQDLVTSQMNSGMTMMMSGAILGGASNILSASSSSTHNGNYGNATVGYGFDNYVGAEAAMMNHKANNMITDCGLLVQMAYLEAQWKAVE